VRAVRSVLPTAAPVLRSLAIALAAVLCALQWGPPGSATVVAGAAGIAGAAALQDNPRGRVPRVLVLSLVLGVSVLAGSATAGHRLIFVVVAGLWCFAAAMLWALGSDAGLVASASGALLVIAAATPPDESSVPILALLAVGAGVLQAVMVTLWPPRRWRMQREALTAAYRSLADLARQLAANHQVDEQFWATQPMAAVRAAFTAGTPARQPAGARHRYLPPEQIGAALVAVADTADPADALQAAADALAAIADPHRSARPTVVEALRRLDATADAARNDADASALHRLSRHLHRAESGAPRDFVPSWPDALWLWRPDLLAATRAAARRVRVEYDGHSPVLRHAVRLGIAVAVACAAGRYGATESAGWTAVTVLMVLRPETAHTYTRCVGRTAAVAVGAVIASAILAVTGVGPVVVAALAAFAFGACYPAARHGYLVAAAALAAAVTFVVAIDHPALTASPSALLVESLLGGALAVLAHVALPDDALTRLAQRAGELLKTEIGYAATVVEVYLHELDTSTDVRASAWERTFRARAAFEAAAGAARLESREQRHWLRCYRGVLNAVTGSCTNLEDNLPVDPFPESHAAFRRAVHDYLEALCGTPPTPTDPWTVDTVELTAAAHRVQRTVPLHESDEGAARVLAAEVMAISRQLARLAAARWPVEAR